MGDQTPPGLLITKILRILTAIYLYCTFYQTTYRASEILKWLLKLLIRIFNKISQDYLPVLQLLSSHKQSWRNSEQINKTLLPPPSWHDQICQSQHHRGTEINGKSKSLASELKESVLLYHKTPNLTNMTTQKITWTYQKTSYNYVINSFICLMFSGQMQIYQI